MKVSSLLHICLLAGLFIFASGKNVVQTYTVKVGSNITLVCRDQMSNVWMRWDTDTTLTTPAIPGTIGSTYTIRNASLSDGGCYLCSSKNKNKFFVSLQVLARASGTSSTASLCQFPATTTSSPAVSTTASVVSTLVTVVTTSASSTGTNTPTQPSTSSPSVGSRHGTGTNTPTQPSTSSPSVGSRH
eukprot:scpid97726/ scgid19367/ 